MALEGNKADLALPLSNHLIERSPTGHPVVVVTGVFATTVSDFALHSCSHGNASCCSDTDVLLLLLPHYDRMGCTRLYMKAGTSNAPKYFPVHEIGMLPYIDLVVDTLHEFHAITGYDSVSQFSGHGKKTG